MKFWRPQSANFIVGAVIVLLIAVGAWFIVNNFQSTTSIRIESAVFQVKLADTGPERERGLGGVEKISENGGMLLAFPENDYHQIWMKDMLAAIDIIWFDESKRVVHIVRDAQPEGGVSTIFTPSKPARYVLEIPAGKAKESGIKVGSTAVFSIDETELE